MLIRLIVLFMLFMPLGMADAIVGIRPEIHETADKYDVNPILMEAIIRWETNHGKSKAFQKKKNVAGIMGKRGLKYFKDHKDSIDSLGYILKVYQDKGLGSVPKISRRYAPDASKSWSRNVSLLMKQIQRGTWGTYVPEVTTSSDED